MTPERIEEIKERLTERQARKGSLSTEEVELMEALAALEEAEKQIQEWQGEANKWLNELVEKEIELGEAQQTIARQSELLNEAVPVLFESRATIRRQREVLEWYADEDIYRMVTRWRGDPASPIDCDVIDDGGTRARSILEDGHSDTKAPKYILWREWNAESPPEPENMYLVTDGSNCEKAWLSKDDDDLIWYLPDLRSINRREDITHYGVIELPGGNKEGSDKP